MSGSWRQAPPSSRATVCCLNLALAGSFDAGFAKSRLQAPDGVRRSEQQNLNARLLRTYALGTQPGGQMTANGSARVASVDGLRGLLAAFVLFDHFVNSAGD